MTKPRVGVIGVGHLGKQHARIYHQLGALAEVEKIGGQYPEIRTLIEFLRGSDLGHMGRRRESRRPAPPPSTPPPEPEEDIE